MLAEKLERGGLILDGAMGTELGKHSEEEIYRAYLRAGVDLLRTNSFHLEGREEEMKSHCELARKCIEEAGREVLLLASLGPTSYSLQRNPEKADIVASSYRKQIEAILESPVDALLLETVTDTENVLQALEILEGRLPVIVSFALTQEGRLYSGESLEEAMKSLEEEDILAFGLNCCPLAEKTWEILEELRRLTEKPLFFYPNASSKESLSHRQLSEKELEELLRALEEGKIQVLGGCCGNGLDYIERLQALRRQKD